MAATQAAQVPRAEPAWGTVGAPRPAMDWDELVRDWDAVPDPLGGNTLFVVLEQLGWLN